MTKSLLITSALAVSLFLPHLGFAQSPWESGAYKDYAPSASDDQPTSGLEGYSLSPTQQQQAVPSAPQPAQAAPATTSSATRAVQPGLVASSTPTIAAPKFSIGMTVPSAGANDNLFLVLGVQSSKTLTSVSQLAAKKSQNQDTQRLATQILAFYAPLHDDMKELQSKNSNLVFNETDTRDKDILATMNAANAADFDNQYTTIVRQKLTALHHAFSLEASGGQNAELKAYAVRKLPTIKSESDAMQKSFASSIQQQAMAQQASSPSAGQMFSGTIPSIDR